MEEERLSILKKELFDLRFQLACNKRNTEITKKIEKEIEIKRNEMKKSILEKETIERRK